MAPLVNLAPSNDEPLDRLALVTNQAAALFLRDGIAAVRMTDIADASGIGVATLYRRFKTKTSIAIHAGMHMWGLFNDRIRRAIETDAFLAMNGAERLTMLFEKYIAAYSAYPEFVRFLDEFDHMVLAEGAEPEELSAYGRAIDSFYIIFEDAYQLGCADGSVTRKVDFPVLYRTVAHAMMGVAQHLVRGEVIPSDDFANGTNELTCIVQMARYTLGIAEETVGNE